LQADNAERQETQAQLEALLKEKEVLLKEMNHRVKNNLQIVASLLCLQADTIQDVHVRKMFEESRHRINTMALIHETLYQAGDVAEVEFATYLRTLVTQLLEASSVDPQQITLEVDADAIPLELTTAIPCGLLVNELVTNCLQHAFPEQRPGSIRIVLKANADGHVTLQVSDTGVGFPDGMNFRTTESLGLQLICLLAEQLGGTISLERIGGTTFTITFPIAGTA
jgi:two-component sensor histidine kinase